MKNCMTKPPIFAKSLYLTVIADIKKPIPMASNADCKISKGKNNKYEVIPNDASPPK